MRVPNVANGSVTSNSPATSAPKTERASRAYSSKESEKSNSSQTKSTGESAQVDISAKAKDMSLAKKIASESPDVREDRVAELKRRIQNQEYNVKPEDIADRMVDEHIRTAGLS